MAFFTRVNLNVPVLPPEETAEKGCGPDHRRHASEPSRVSSRPPAGHRRSSAGPPANGAAEAEAPDAQKPEEEDGEPKRYEYVVDRVLGVEV